MLTRIKGYTMPYIILYIVYPFTGVLISRQVALTELDTSAAAELEPSASPRFGKGAFPDHITSPYDTHSSRR